MPRLKLTPLWLVIALVGISIEGVAQEIKIPPNASPEQRKAMMEAMKARQRGGKPPAGKPATPPKNAKPGDKKPGAKPDAKKDDKKDASGPVKRPDTPKEPADKTELEAKPGADGKMVLNFRGHPWTAMIEWFSMASGREVEWTELPSGFVNLRTRKRYSMEETRDILNRLLLARGYTMLDDGEFLMIEKTEGINTALVPRVRPTQLVRMMPHSFVRTSFRLQRAQADELVKELESMKSKNGKLNALASANRIEAMDSVRNLVYMSQTIDDEEASDRYRPQEFKLRHVRASVIKTKLEEMLGLKTQSAPMTPQQMQQMQRMQQQMAQQNKGKPQPQKKEEKISLVVNEINNSIIVKAPPNRMMDIAETIDYLDIERNRGGLDSYVDRVKTYRFATLNPEEVKNILMETAGLDPTTNIRVDKTSKSIIVDAPPWDHLVVQKLATKLDGSARQFKVIQLRRLSAVQVATTVEAMMGEPEDDSKKNRYSYYYYRYGQQEEDDKKDKFTIGADTENNRLLLKCNDLEYQTVLDLLRQLGEIPRTGNVENQIVLDVPGEDQDAFLRRVQEAFKSYAPNPVILPPEQPKEKPEKEKTDEEKDDTVDPAIEARRPDDDRKVTSRPTRTTTMFTQLTSDKEDDAEKLAPRNDALPILIERNAQGQLVLRSKDTAALEMFEELMRRMSPKKQDWVHFKLKYVTALWMKYQLEDFFEEEEEDNGFGRFFYFYDYGRNDDKKAPGLGDQPTIRFIDDGESTLVVRNASPTQLATIRRLIDLYDVSEPPNEQNARFRQMIHIKHSKARTVEAALKEAFRDLLSNKDKVFDEQNKGGNKEGNSSSRRGSFWGGGWGNDDDSYTGLGTSTFKGKISFGVDESTNILIVTTEGKQLMDIIVEMVDELDKAAVPNDDTRVVSLPPRLNSESLRDTLTKMFGPEVVQEKPNKNGQDPNQQQNNNQNQQKGEGNALQGR